MPELVKGKILREDIQLYDGNGLDADRLDSAGGLFTGRKVGNRIDVLSVFGNGTDFDTSTLSKAVRSVGSTEVTFELAPGTWLVEADLSSASNITWWLVSGAVFSISSGVTLTANGPVFAEGETFKSGDGTLSATPMIDLQTLSIFDSNDTQLHGYIVTD